MKTTITIEVKTDKSDMYRLNKRARKIYRQGLDMVEDTIQDALFGELGLINVTNVTKIE